MTHRSAARRTVATLISITIAILVIGGAASALIVPTVNLGTAANYSVVAGQTVTNVNNPGTTLSLGLALSPGSAITGFPPGIIDGSVDIADAEAVLAQSHLTAAYVDAQTRVPDFTIPAQLGNQVLIGGVYSATLQGALLLTGPLTLDAQGDPNTVFIIQTDSELTTASASTVILINRAQECNVFWQVGSSATLGTNSVFAGNILAQASVTVTTGTTVRGRAMAIDGSVTLDTNTFTTPTCDFTLPSDPIPPATTTSTTSTTAVGGATTTTAGSGGTSTTAAGGAGTPTTSTPFTSLPFTGSPTGGTLALSISAFAIGTYLMRRARFVKR